MLTYFEKLLQLLGRIFQALVQLASNQDKRLAELESQIGAVQKTVDEIKTLLYLPEADHLEFTVTIEGQTNQGATQVNLTDSQKASLSITPVDKKGNAAVLDGVPAWASSDETIATILADATGLNADLTAVRPGSCDITVTGDADLGAGVTPIVGTLTVTVTPGQAVQITIDEGTITEQ